MRNTRLSLDIMWNELYPDGERPLLEYGPSVSALKAFCWKVRYPPKIKHFLWQLVSGCIAVKNNLKSRGIQGDTVCARCGAPEESINHVFSNVHRRFKYGLSHGYLRTQTFPPPINLCKYGSFVLESFHGYARSSFFMDFIVHMEMKKEQSL